MDAYVDEEFNRYEKNIKRIRDKINNAKERVDQFKTEAKENKTWIIYLCIIIIVLVVVCYSLLVFFYKAQWESMISFVANIIVFVLVHLLSKYFGITS